MSGSTPVWHVHLNTLRRSDSHVMKLKQVATFAILSGLVCQGALSKSRRGEASALGGSVSIAQAAMKSAGGGTTGQLPPGSVRGRSNPGIRPPG